MHFAAFFTKLNFYTDKRFFSTMARFDFLEVKTDNSDVPLLKLHPMWLRDHCR